ncbi:acyl-CoA dehydrogenase family protein [Ectobacillus ponti]|uniref:Acyl-CoA/acyl-ACP dehydrogenase n=1 Tax=Ectobacillus ponti TaxID=2961894 RepID=A0AA42BPT0_9BACI|nr:acyl-CoA dehydrogenase family protein [Ectobacillus ponti]MCP8969490.1 acyl-CoA/acyl-ACP dehydrogenase [Ectobacillus ponti]
MADVFIRTKKQAEIMAQLQALVPIFQSREHELDALGSFPFQNIADLKGMGYHKLTLPKEYGGEAASLYDLLLFQEKIAEGDGATALSIGWHMGIMQELTENRQWEEELFAWMCGEVQHGALLNRAASERATGSPARGGRPETAAVRIENGWQISGRKTFTSMAPALDYILISAWVEEEGQIGEFLIPRKAAGVSIEETWDSVAMRGTASHDLVLEQVQIPPAYLVEWRNSPRPKNSGWLLHIAACYLGIAQAARQYALRFAASYHNNSTQEPISSLPNVRRLIAEMELELLTARHMMYGVAAQYDASEQRGQLKRELAAVKHVATNAAIAVVDKAMRIVGARSLSAGNPLHRYYVNVRAGLHNPPADDITMSLLTEQALAETRGQA